MSDSFIQVPPDSTGKKLDTEQLTVGANTVERERMQIAGDSATDIAPVTATDGLLVNLGANNDVTISDGGNSITVDGTVTVTEPVSVDDNGGSLTVDNATLAVVGGGAEATALRVTIADDSTGVLSIDDGGGVITVDGTVAVTNAGLTELAAAIDTEVQVDIVGALPTGDNNIGNVDVASSALPTGAATSALQLPDGHNVTVDNASGAAAVNIQDGGNSITVDGTVTVTATNLDVRDIDAATDDITVHGDVGVVDQFDLTNSNPLAVAIVDGDGTQISSFGGGTQYTEDAAAAANPVGTALNLVRQDTPAGLVSADGDNVAARGTNFGAMYAQIVTSAGAFVDTFGGGTQYTEDAAAAADPVGGALIMVRNDTLEGITSADGDNVAARGTDKGELYVKHVDAIPVTDNGGALTVDGTVAVSSVGGTVAVTQSGAWDEVGIHDSGNSITVDAANLDIRDIDAATDDITIHGDVGIVDQMDLTNANPLTVAIVDDNGDQITSFGGGTQYTEDAAGAADPVGGTLIMIRDDALSGQTSADGDNVAVRGTDKGELYVKHVDTIPVTQSGTWDEVGIHDSGNSITVDNGTLSVVGGGAEATALRVTLANDSTGVVSVDDNGGALTVDGTVTIQDGGNTITVDGTVAVSSLPASTNTLEVVGDVAADAAAAGNPVAVGVVQETMADSAPSTRVSADADIGYAAASDGAQYVIPTGPQTWSYHENSSSALTDTSVHAAPGAGLSLYVTDIIVSTGAATAFNIFFEEGASTVLGPYYLEAVAGRGFQVHFQTPKKITANTALTVTTSAAIAHGIDVTGFIARG